MTVEAAAGSFWQCAIASTAATTKHEGGSSLNWDCMAAIMNGGKQPASMPLPPHLGSAAAAAAGSCFSGRYSPTYRAAPPDPMRARHCAMANAAPVSTTTASF